jgi:hypothetical protein
LLLAPSWAALAQEPAPVEHQAERRTVGTVAAVGHGSLVLRTDQGGYVIFEFTRDTIHAQPVTTGARVSVVTSTSDTDEAPTALAIDTLPKPQGLAEQAPDPVPSQVLRLEQQIARQARRYRAGVQAGAGLDPEMISLNAFAQLGAFNRNLAFRPNVEFAFGELTTLFGLHLDALFSLQGMSRSSRWVPYLGAGPTFALSHRGFEETTVNGEDEVKRFDFGDFSWNNGFNFIVGARSPKGTFFELKATAYGISKIRMMAGFEF